MYGVLQPKHPTATFRYCTLSRLLTIRSGSYIDGRMSGLFRFRKNPVVFLDVLVTTQAVTVACRASRRKRFAEHSTHGHPACPTWICTHECDRTKMLPLSS